MREGPTGAVGRPEARWREASAAELDAFAGFRGRHRFPHRLGLLHRGGPDGLKLATRMCGVDDPARLRQLLLFAADGHLDDLPDEIFFDPELMWHGQNLGRRDLVATATLVVEPALVSVVQMFSDLAQRIGLRRDLKSRVENRVHGWAHLVVNGILVCAYDLGVPWVRFPTSTRILDGTDPARSVDPSLFIRVYDRTVRERTTGQEKDGWWWVDVPAQEHRIGPLRRRTERLDGGPVVCVAHDIERDLGHRDTDPEFARSCVEPARRALDRMLEVEAAAGVRATYNVVGTLFDDVAPVVRRGGHALGFHSHSHVVASRPSAWSRLALRWRVTRSRAVFAATASREYMELAHCREVDDRLRGYRPPQSRLSPGLHERHLAFFNYEWLASSAYSLGLTAPALESGIVKIPIHMDDYALHRGTPFAEWRTALLEAAAAEPFTAVSLHDCYGPWWLDRYPELLQQLADLGDFRTFDEVADGTLLASTEWT